MYKISKKIISFIINAMENWKVELMVGGQNLSRGKKSKEAILQRDLLLPLLFIIAIMPLNHLFRKCTEEGGYKSSKTQEKIITLWMTKVFVKNEKKKLETLILTKIYSQNVGMEFDIEKCAMLTMKSGETE